MPGVGSEASKLREALRAAFPGAKVSLRSQPRPGPRRPDWRARIAAGALAVQAAECRDSR